MMIEIEEIQEKAVNPPSDVNSENRSVQIQPESQIQQTPTQPFPILLYPFVDIIVHITNKQLIVTVLLIANYTKFSSSFIGYYYDTSAKESLIESYCYAALPQQYPSQAQMERCVQYEQFYYRRFYSRYERVMTNTQPLFIASFVIPAIMYIVLSRSSLNATLAKIACFIFTVFQIFLIVGFCLVSQYYLDEWNVWSCIILIFFTFSSLNICKKCQLSNQNLAIVSLLIPQIALLCYGQAGFKIESVGIATLFSLNGLYWINQDYSSNSSWINSLKISGLFFQHLISSIMILAITPCQTILRFAYRNQNKIKNCSQEQKRNHLIQAYTIILIIIGMSLFMVGLTNYTDVYTLYGKLIYEKVYDTRNWYQIVFKYNSLSLVSYIIVPSSHVFCMLLYPKSGQNLLFYILSQALLRLEIIFIPILFGSLVLTEANQYMTDSHCVEYSLFFTGLGVIALLGYSIGNVEHNEDKQLKYTFILPISSLIMIIYQMDYMSIGIGFTAGFLFTFYIHYQSNVIINRTISQVYIDDSIVAATQCLNPAQLVNDFIQYLTYRRSGNSDPNQIQ